MLKDIGNDIYCIIYGRFIGAIYIRCIYICMYIILIAK